MKNLQRFCTDVGVIAIWVTVWPAIALRYARTFRRMERSFLPSGAYSRHLKLSRRFTLYGVSGLAGLCGFGLLFRLPVSSWLWPLDFVLALGAYSFVWPFWKLTREIPLFRT